MPEGIERLLEAWGVLRRDLDREGPHRWGAVQMSRAVNLTGVRSERSHDTRIGDLSNALWGEFHNLTAQEGGDLDNEARRNWARAALLELVDTQIAELDAHKGDARTSIGSSKTAAKHRPEPSSTIWSKRVWRGGRGRSGSRFPTRLPKELRQVECRGQDADRDRARASPSPDLPDARMGLFCEATPPADRERALAFLDVLTAENPPVRGSDGLLPEHHSTPPAARLRRRERVRKP